jgi:hypothetical protein
MELLVSSMKAKKDEVIHAKDEIGLDFWVKRGSEG